MPVEAMLVVLLTMPVGFYGMPGLLRAILSGFFKLYN